MNDYNELELYLNDDEELTVVDLWVYTDHNKFFIIKGVNNNPIRYQGWWSIPFIQHNDYATAYIEADKVLYFVTISKGNHA